MIKEKSSFFKKILQPSNFTAKITFTVDQWVTLKNQKTQNEETKFKSSPQFVFDFIEHTINTKLSSDQNSAVAVIQIEPFDYYVNLLFQRKNVDHPQSCFSKITEKICKTKVVTVSDLSE